jgi:hypothetical protein
MVLAEWASPGIELRQQVGYRSISPKAWGVNSGSP